MIRILVLEDEQPKSSKICSVLLGLDFSKVDVVPVMDVASVKRELRKQYFDLAVIDIAVPWQPDGDVQRDAGFRLVQELFASDELVIPMHIFGLTGFPELVQSSGLPPSIFSVQLFDPSSSEWVKALELRVRQIAACKSALAEDDGRKYRTDLGIVCALDNPELSEVLALPWGWTETILPHDPTIYHEGQFNSAGARRVVAAAASRMGLTAASITTSKLITTFRPRYVAMVGIAAGVPGRVNYGDVVAGDPVWDWGSGKWTLVADNLKFLPAPHQLDLEPALRNVLRKLGADTVRLAKVKSAYRGPKPDSELRLLIGPFASGAAVLADGLTMPRIVEQNRNLLGVDMEAYGVLAATFESSVPRPQALALKSIVDFANTEKNDAIQPYAAFTSAAILRILVEEYLHWDSFSRDDDRS